MKQVKIDYSQKWQLVHLRGIQSAYGKAPFFEYYFPYFEELIQTRHQSLFELNQQVLTICLKLLRWSVKVVKTQSLPLQDDVQDIRGQIEPGRPFSERSFLQPVPYTQLFGLDFEPNLGILDLLFCAGPEADKILRKSAKKQ